MDRHSSDPHASPKKRTRSRDTELTSEERTAKRLRREEKRKRKELRRLRRAARATIPSRSDANEREKGNVERNTSSEENEDGEAEGKLADNGIFVWKKKNELLRKQGQRVTVENELERKHEIQRELEYSKRRRAEREAERAERERTQAQHAREREQAENEDWHRSERTFVGKQHLLRQAIRLREGRYTDIDQLARNMRLDLLDVAHDPRSPAEYIAERVRLGMTAAEVENVLEQVETELDCLADFAPEGDTKVFNHSTRLQWWTSIQQFLTALARSLRELCATAVGPSAIGLHSSVQRDVDELLRGKSKSELQTLERTLADKLAGHASGAGEEKVYGEVDFWAAAIRSIRSQLAEVQVGELSDIFAAERERLLALSCKDGDGGMSGMKKGNRRRGRSGEEMVKVEEAKGMGDGEEKFEEEAVLPSSTTRSKDKGWKGDDAVGVRKPRYFNRVHTGYDWTKYNRTHYDQNNPPPKTVQGYKFNIFYPDLVNPSVIPTYSIIHTDNPDVCIIRFSACRPYEDIAFKIINRPWEQSHRKGYKCDFDRGVLRLWFTFQRYRYRR